MKKIETIIKPSKLDDIHEVLVEVGITGMTVSGVKGFGRQKDRTEIYHGVKYAVDFLPKVKIKLVLTDDKVDQAVDVISETAHSGKIGDGKVLIYPAEEATRVRTDGRPDVVL